MLRSQIQRREKHKQDVAGQIYPSRKERMDIQSTIQDYIAGQQTKQINTISQRQDCASCMRRNISDCPCVLSRGRNLRPLQANLSDGRSLDSHQKHLPERMLDTEEETVKVGIGHGTGRTAVCPSRQLAAARRPRAHDRCCGWVQGGRDCVGLEEWGTWVPPRVMKENARSIAQGCVQHADNQVVEVLVSQIQEQTKRRTLK